jgi:hypothetical protein
MAKRKKNGDELDVEERYYNPNPEATLPPPVSLEDAPNDGRVYGRRNGQWVVLTMKAIMMQRPAVQKKSPAAGQGSGADDGKGSD